MAKLTTMTSPSPHFRSLSTNLQLTSEYAYMEVMLS